VRLRIDFAASIPKDVASAELNEDAWAHNEELTCIALSDGASESFDSRTWANSLVSKYVFDQRFKAAWVEEAVREYAQSIDFDNLGWAAQRAFERGSFATFLGLKLAENGTDLDILCVGDSLAMHVRRGAALDTYPFQQPEEFDARPTLISTRREANQFLDESGFFSKASTTWTVAPGDVVYIATDAVGHWLLTEAVTCAETMETLQGLNAETEFQALVLDLRNEHRMKLDDSTLIRLVVE
jgi:hypothetical protein